MTKLPGASMLKIEAWDYDTLFSDDLIGYTEIDIEDRYYDHNWEQLEEKPIEVRPLLHPDIHGDQGYISLWVEVFEKKDKNAVKKWEITPPPNIAIEARVIVWETREIINMDDEGTSDLYVTTFFDVEEKSQTDLHFRCQTGKGSFNWRNLLKVEIPRKGKSSMLNVQVYDKDFFSADDFICSTVINLDKLLREIYEVDVPIKVVI